MLAGLVGSLVAAGLLLRGAWDPWSQVLILSVALLGASLWLCARLFVGWAPAPSGSVARWSAALAAGAVLSAWASPAPAYARLSAAALIPGFLLFPVVECLSEEERALVDRFVRAAAWAMALLAVYQHFHGEPRPPSSLHNQNAFAGAVLLLIPLAARGGDWPLVGLLALCLWWTRSVGAWLGLAVALTTSRRVVGAAGYWLGAAAGFAGLVAVYAKLQSPETAHRLAWWAASWRMSLDAPLLGLGPGTFAYALPAYAPQRPDLSSLFAHQHFLETAAERGWPQLLLWIAGVVLLLLRAAPQRRFGPLAALTHGLVDYPLSLPGVFWLFCLETASILPQSAAGASVRSRWKAPLIAVTALTALLGMRGLWRIHAAQAARAEGFAALREGRPSVAQEALARSQGLAPHPETARLLAEAEVARAAADPVAAPAALERAARDLERAIALDPWRASNRAMLEAVRRKAAAGAAR